MKIEEKDLRVMLGIQEGTDTPAHMKEKLERVELNYRRITGKEKEEAVLQNLKRIEKDTQIVGIPERTQVWEKGWNENKQRLLKEHNVNVLRPVYFRENIPVRLYKEFIMPEVPTFEYDLGLILKTGIYEMYMGEYEHIYEFGCGTGYNLIQLSEIYPEKELNGLDFTENAVEILEILNKEFGYHIHGQRFDFTSPDYDLKIKENSAIFTFAALEQVGRNFSSFLEYLLMQKPEICIHLEPVAELYDEENIVDWCAKKFHRKRHYLDGFLPVLQELAEKGKIKINKIKRLEFGNFNHEGYTLVVWKPCR